MAVELMAESNGGLKVSHGREIPDDRYRGINALE